MQNYARTNRFQYLSDILILGGLVIICALVFGLLGKIVSTNVFSMSGKEFLSFLADTTWFNDTGNLKLYNTFSTFGAWVVSGWLLFRIRRYRISEFWKFGSPRPERTWALLPLLFLSAIFVASWLLYLNQLIDVPESLKKAFGSDASERLMEQMLAMENSNQLLVNLLVIALVPAVFEEIFFRGTLQPLMTGSTGNVHIGIFISSLFFAAIHLNVMQIIPMFFLALVLAYLYHYTGSLLPGIVIHFCNNALAVLANYYKDSSPVAKKVADDTYVPGVWEVLLFLVLLTGIFYYFHRQSLITTTDE